jgi:cytochrome c biogenesis protein CcdA
MEPFALLGLGLVLGLRHAADPDHVVAVTAIVARHRSPWRAAVVGAVWGLGHTLTILLAGGVIVLLELAVPHRTALALEMVVAVVIVALGLLNVFGRGGDERAATPEAARREDATTSARAFGVGLVHGLAGSSAIALVVLATVREPLAKLAYLGVFGVGTLVGMTLVTLAFATPVAALARRFAWNPRGIRVATGLASVAFGVWLAAEIGWTEGLFRG